MDNLAREAERLYNRVKQVAKPTPTAENQELERMARKLYDDFRSPQYSSRELERQANVIKEYLYHEMKEGCMMTTHCTELKTGYEQLRLNLRKFE